MRGTGSSLRGRRKSGSGGGRTPERWDMSRSSTVSSSSSSASGGGGGKPSSSYFASSSGRNPVFIAARAIGQCFGSADAGSKTTDYSEDYKSSSGSTQGSSYDSTRGSSYGSSRGSEIRRSGRGIYGNRQAFSSQRESVSGRTRFTMADIHKATRNFSPSFKIGQGGFGTVYKGTLDDGTVVAIKRAKKSVYDKHLSVEFQSEVQTLAQVEHLNLVRFLGYLEHEDERIVVVEYVPNGTLREHLDGGHGSTLDLAARLDIAIDVAHAVTYLHMYTDHPIIHRDIKSSNILLTENLRAKVADFGFARLGATEAGVTHVSTQVKGTAGYLDPEYLRTYQLTVKSDVYSFGVLLVELITGRRPIETKKEIKERITAKWAIKKFTDGNAIQTLDPNLSLNPATNLALEKILELSLQCLAPTRQNRPSMQRCAEILWSIRKDYRELMASDPLSQSSHQRNPSVNSIKKE